ncbi:MAG: Gfo/Idh/MocA family protein [Christensenellales bacterium]|jgi:predicted dehydrogenase
MDDTKILLVGIGGYGDVYVNALRQGKARGGYQIAGVVDPFAQRAPSHQALLADGVPFYSSLEDFYRDQRADLAVISTPTSLHAEQAMIAISQNTHVLVEKPIAATHADAQKVADAATAQGVKLAVGFQWCYDAAMLRFKRDVDAGRFGAPKRMRALVIWPRDKAYYARGTGWAGKKYDAQGRAAFDSVASNATAHYIENMLWIAGSGYDGSAVADLESEIWRANAIETFDTVTFRATLDCGAQIYYAASHATKPGTQQDPMFEYEFERATARFGGFGEKGARLTATFHDGSVKDYGVSDNGTDVKIWTMLDAIRNGADIPCPPAAAIKHAQLISMLHKASPEARVLENIVETEERVYVPGLEDRLVRCYEARALLSEIS